MIEAYSTLSLTRALKLVDFFDEQRAVRDDTTQKVILLMVFLVMIFSCGLWLSLLSIMTPSAVNI